MKVIIDISPLKTGHKTRGIGIYTRRLVEALHKVDRKNQYILTSKAQYVPDADLIHYPYFDLFFHTLPIRKKAPTVITIHDLIPLVMPNQFPVGVRGRIANILQRTALKNVDSIITDSENSKQDIEEFLDISANKIHVVYLAAAAGLKPQAEGQVKFVRKKYSLPPTFALYVGDVNPNKNLPRLVEAFATVVKKIDAIYLVLVGKAFRNKKLREVQAITDRIRDLGLEKKVLIRTNVPLDPSQELAAIYTAASVYVQPSLYEGFGLPILEAFACEVPVVAANSSSIPEITNGAAILVDPRSKKELANAIIEVLRFTPEKRQEMVRKGKTQTQKFSWDLTAKETLKVYELVHASGGVK